MRRKIIKYKHMSTISSCGYILIPGLWRTSEGVETLFPAQALVIAHYSYKS